MVIVGVTGFLACHGYPREKNGFFGGRKKNKKKTEKRFLGWFNQKITKQKTLKVEILPFLAESEY